MLFVNLLGGGAVIGSYVWGFLTHSNAGQALWGGVPDSIRPFYTAGMFLAATGYFAFTYFILFRLNPSETRVFSRFPFDLFNVLYAAILISSALWMPLTLFALEGSSLGFVRVVRIVLAMVGLASVALLFALLKVEPRLPSMGPPAGRGRMCGFLSPDGHPGRDRMGGILYSLNKNLLIPLRV